MCFIFRQHNKRLNMKRNANKILSVSTLFGRNKCGPHLLFSYISPYTKNVSHILYADMRLVPVDFIRFLKMGLWSASEL